jgi:hypothetical protein
MEEALRFIDESQTWIYIILLFVGLVYLRLGLIRWVDLRKAVYGLERERSLSKLTQAGAMLALIFALAVAVFVVANFVAPAYLANVYTAPPQDQNPVSTVQEISDDEQTPISSGLPIMDGLPTLGCSDENVSLTSPEDGGTVSGVVEVRGTANDTAFGFYQYHYMLMSPEASWNVVTAGNEPVVDDVLGVWDTTWLIAGEYFLRLVVTNTEGEATAECVIQVRVVPAP